MNLYRPQMAYTALPGFRDEEFRYSFDSSNVAILGVAILAGQVVNDIYLQLQNEAEFICRGIRVQLNTAPSDLQLWLKEPFGSYLSQTYIPLATYLTGAGAAICGRMTVVFEPEISCPAGSFFTAFLRNPTTGSVTPPSFSFFGVKRWPLECAA